MGSHSADAACSYHGQRSRPGYCHRSFETWAVKSSRFLSLRFANRSLSDRSTAHWEIFATYDWLILTSVNGVEALFERMAKKRLGAEDLAHLKIAAIGPATKGAIEKHGLSVTATPKEYIAESVVSTLRRRVTGKRVLLVRAKVARDVIPRELRKVAAVVDVSEAYETVTPKSSAKKLRSLLANEKRRPHAITFTSSSTVKNFVGLLGLREARAALKKTHGIHSASIGPVTSATLREFGLPVHIQAAEYTIPGLVKAIVERAVEMRKR